MLTDPHAAKRATIESCATCRCYFPTPKGNHGDCHFMPPNPDSFFPTVYPDVWCAQYRADSLKIEHHKQKAQEK